MKPLNQIGILRDLPALSRYVFWDVRGDAAAVRAALGELQAWADGLNAVVALGEPLVQALGTRA